MAENNDRKELKRRLAQARRVAPIVDALTRERLEKLVEEQLAAKAGHGD